MSKQIDEKVVEMRFDNSQFEKNVQTSISSLEKLKSNLKFDGASKGLDEVSSSMEDTNGIMSTLTAGVESVGAKFSALEVIAITALANITNSVVNTGKQLVASLTVDQLAAGFSKYEQKTTAVQTIVNATGKSLDEVNGQLEKLNWFTDETSYNFTDMVGNIGKFTSMGIDLGTSVTAMMGIANWAALSGQGTNEASRAMYNLSQAIGVGAVKLQDWKSIENANMATKEFKDIAIETAKALGTLTEEGKTAGKTVVESSNFSSTLSDGWFTSEVLLAALEKYGNYSEEVYKVASEQGLTAADAMKIVSDETMELGAKAFKAAQEAKTFTDAINATKDAVSTGWMNTFEIIFGNYEEAKVLWTDLANELYDIFAAGAEDRNDLLDEWKEMGGRTKLIEGFYNALIILKNVIQTVKASFRDIFPAKTAEQLYGLTESFYKFTEKLKNNEKPLENMKRMLKGFFAVLDIGKQLIGSIIRVLSPILGKILTVGGGVADLGASLGDLLVKLDETIRRTGIFDKAFQKIISVITTAINAIRGFFKEIKQTKFFNGLVSLLNRASVALKNFINSVKEKFSTPGFELFHALLEKIKIRLSQLGKILTVLKNAFINVIEAIATVLSTSSILKVLTKIWSIIVIIAKCIVNLLGKALSTLSEKLKAGDFKGFLDIINAISVGGIAIGITKFVKSFTDAFSGVSDILKSVSGILDGVRGCFEAYQKKLKADTLLKIAGAIAILVAALLVLSLIDSEKLFTAIAALTSLFIGLMTSMSILTKMSGKVSGAMKTTTMMLGMSLAVLILASALKKLASINPSQMIVGLVGLSGVVAALLIATKIIGNNTKSIMKGATQLILFGIAIRILVSSVKALSKLSWEDMAKGLVGVGVLMAEVAAFLAIAKFNKKSVSTALGMILLASAIKILASACKQFARLSWEEIGKGLVGVGAVLLELVAFTRLVKPSKMISTGLGLIAIGGAMNIFASAMHSMATLSWEEIAKGLVAMAGSLVLITLALNFLPKGMITKGLGLIAVATAILILGTALNSMGNMNWESIAKGLVALGGSMAILAIGLNVMKGTLAGSAALLIAAVALAIFVPMLALMGSLSWATIGKGLLTLAGAFVVLGVAGLVLGPVVPAILGLAAALALIGVGLLSAGIGITALSVGFTALATAGVAAATSVVAVLTIIITGVAQTIPTIAIMLAQGIIEFVRVLGEGAPVLLEAIKEILLSLIDLIIACGPPFIEAVVYLLACTLKAIASYTPQIVQAVFDILIACLEGIANNICRVVQAGVDIVVGFIEGIASKIPDIIQAGVDLVLSFINGIAEAIENNTQPMIDAITRLVKAIINAAVAVLTAGVDLFSEAGGNLMAGLSNGIKDAWTKVKNAVSDMGEKVKNWFCDTFGIHSPSRVFADYGMYMDLGLASGLEKYAGEVEDSTDVVGDSAISGMSNAIEKISNIVDNEEFAEPTIRPVIDLSEIQNGAGRINRMMSDIDDYSLSGSFNLAQQASRGMKSSSENGNDLAINGLAKSIEKMAQNPSETINNTFNITGDNPKEIAEQVSEILDKKVQRKKVSWA